MFLVILHKKMQGGWKTEFVCVGGGGDWETIRN